MKIHRKDKCRWTISNSGKETTLSELENKKKEFKNMIHSSRQIMVTVIFTNNSNHNIKLDQINKTLENNSKNNNNNYNQSKIHR